MKSRNPIRIAAAVVAILALAGPVASAGATTHSKTHRYTASLTSARLSTANGFPRQGGTASFAGTLNTSAFGAGAVVDDLSIIGISPTKNVVKGTEVDLYPNGTQRSTFWGTDTIGPDGSQHVAITGDFTGGTGRYRKASGSYQFTGSSAPGSTILHGTSHGKVSY